LRGKKLPDPRILPNAGSFFKNPVIPLNQYEQLKSKYKGIFHILEDGSVKLSAAGLIEQCGWKGYRKGDAGVFDRHALILVNHGKATGMDIFNLAKAVRTSVVDEFGIRLQFEVNVISKVPLLSEL